MKDHPSPSGLIQTWVRVVDSDGRAHLEARWSAPESAATSPATHAA